MDRSSSVIIAEQEFYRTASVPWSDVPGQNSPFVVQLAEAFGEDFVPDADFFVESWTYGATAAAENRLRERQVRKDRAQQKPSFQYLDTFIPRFSSEEFVSQRQRECDLNIPSLSDAGTHVSPPEQEVFPQNREHDYEMNEPLTVQRACRLLGVDMSCDRSQIKTAYKLLARLNHPDHMMEASGEARRVATKRMISINCAYHLLCSSRC